MKKSRFILVFSLVLCAAFCIVFTGCQNAFSLSDYVSELRSDIYYGESDDYKLKAFYGYKESPFVNDGKVGEKDYTLTFRLLDKETDGATYSVKFSYLDKDYSETFSADPVAGFLTAKFNIENFAEKTFSVTVSCASVDQTVNLSSLLPENTLDYKSALSSLCKSHDSLVNSYVDENGNFTAEIYMRAIVKDNKAFWYVGFASGNDKLKALLVDGSTGEVLAIREIF